MNEPQDKPVPAAPATPSLQINVIQKFLDNQSKELTLKTQELELKKQEDRNQFDYAQKALNLQKEDRAEQRETQVTLRKHAYVFVGGVVIVSLLFLGILAALNKDVLASEIIKAAAYIGGGAVGGYFYGRTKGIPTGSGQTPAP